MLPMGCSWSSFFAEEINTTLVRQTGLLGGSELVSLQEKARYMGPAAPLAMFVFTDSSGIIGTNKEMAAQAGAAAKAALEGAGLECHVLSMPSQQVSTLGVEFNSCLRCYRPPSDRHWKIMIAAKWLLRRRSVSGKQLEILFGHFTQVSMLRRPALSVFAAGCKFVRAFYAGFSHMWESAWSEIRNFVGLLPMIVSDWDMEWHTTAVAYDSCPEGRGTVSTLKEMESVGGVSERARFSRRFGGEAARASALRRLDPLCDVSTVLSSPPPPPDFDQLEADWEISLEFRTSTPLW